MAFVVSTAAFGDTDNTVIGILLFAVNVGILFLAAEAQRKDFKKKRELLALKEEVKNTQKSVVGLAYVRHTLSYRDRRRFFEDYSPQFFGMQKDELMKAAKDMIASNEIESKFEGNIRRMTATP